jgi:hypothetical protein
MDKPSVQHKIETAIVAEYSEVIASEREYFEMIYKSIMAKL